MTWYGQSIHNGGGGLEPLDKLLYDRYFVGKIDGFYVEAGAHDGVYLSNCKAFEEMGWDGLSIEPSKALFPDLARNRPKNKCLRIALSDKEGIADFDCTDYDHGSFSHMTENPSAEAGTTCRHSVATYTFKKIVEDYKIEKVDLFVLDVEGHELKALKGLEGSAVMPYVICVEHVYVGLDNVAALLPGYKMDYQDRQNAFFVKENI